jgi:hypothetical protein
VEVEVVAMLHLILVDRAVVEPVEAMGLRVQTAQSTQVVVEVVVVNITAHS